MVKKIIHKNPNCQCMCCKAKRGEYSGKNNPFYGKYHTEKTKQRMRKFRRSRKGKKLSSGQHRINNRMKLIFNKILKGKKKGTAWSKFVGYNRKELREHLEKQFTLNMSWDNYGTYWVIDHVIPKRLFNMENRLEMMLCWALPNLQPLESHKNNVKSGRIDYYSEKFYDNKLKELRNFVKGRIDE